MHIFSIGEVSRLLGVQAYRIAYAIDAGHVPEASFHFLHKRCFSEADITRIAEHFGVECKQVEETTKGAE